MICIPLFIAAGLLLWYNIADSQGFNTIWRYFGWANQTLAVFSLWAVTVFLARCKGRLWYLVSLLPAAFMTAVSVTFICIDKTGLRLPANWNAFLGVGVFVLSLGLFFAWRFSRKFKEESQI